MNNLDKPIQQQPTSIQVPIEETPKSKTALYKQKPFLVGLAIFLILVVLGGGPILFKEKLFTTNVPTKTSLTPTITTPPQVYKSKNLILKRKTPQGEEVIYSFPESGDRRIARWKDYLFYGSQGYGPKVELLSHNLQTGETKTIYEKDTTRQYVSDLQIINDVLFFSVGGYLAGGATYWFNLPPVNNPQQLTESANGRIEFMKNRYWLIGGEGDACWGTTTYSLLDIATKKVTPVATSQSGCFEGEEYIDIDKRNKMLLSFHTPMFGSYDEQKEDGTYQYVIAVPLSNPSVKEGVIAKQNMPLGITAIKYSEERDQLLLVGKSLFVYDFNSGGLDKIVDLPTAFVNGKVDSWKRESVCIGKPNGNDISEVNIITKQFTQNSPKCGVSPSPTPRPYDEVNKEQTQKLIELLNLPSNYKFVLE